jgi:hypothetical protein
MNLLAIGIGVACALMLAAAALALFALWRAHVLVRELKDRAARREQDNRELAGRVESLSARLQDLECAPSPVAVAPAAPRAGMNLNKRSQVLRLHRQGEFPDQIASNLDLPRQEVDLLIKVHHIIMSNL